MDAARIELLYFSQSYSWIEEKPPYYLRMCYFNYVLLSSSHHHKLVQRRTTPGESDMLTYFIRTFVCIGQSGAANRQTCQDPPNTQLRPGVPHVTYGEKRSGLIATIQQLHLALLPKGTPSTRASFCLQFVWVLFSMCGVHFLACQTRKGQR